MFDLRRNAMEFQIGGLYKYHQNNDVLPYFNENEILLFIKIESYKGGYIFKLLTKKGLKNMYSSALHHHFECLTP
jgi:hypothetical protein